MTERSARGSYNVYEVRRASKLLAGEIGELVRQLSSSAQPPTLAYLQEIVNSPATHLLVARREDGVMLGTLTLVAFRIPTGMRAWIEDVVVDETARGGGVGKEMTRHALALARELGARTVDLTSRPERIAANRLYRRMGFEPRATKVYRFELRADTRRT